MHSVDMQAAPYIDGDEFASSLIHGVGIVLSIVGLATLVAFATRAGDVRHLASVCVYGATLILLYTASALYHSVPFYLWKRLPYNHALWHAFVLLGSVLQFFAVLYYVLPTA